jgi:hypothetical protein
VPLNFYELWGPDEHGCEQKLVGYFLTADAAESRVLKEGRRCSTADPLLVNFLEEPQSAFVFGRQVQGSTPFYRYRSRVSSDHFYTTSQAEGEQAVSRFNYIPESICCYIFPTQVPGSVPLYRLSNNELHYYTVDATMRQRHLINDHYADEGIAGYVYPTQVSRDAN